MPWEDVSERYPVPTSLYSGRHARLALDRQFDEHHPDCARCGHSFLAHVNQFGCTHIRCYRDRYDDVTTLCSEYLSPSSSSKQEEAA